MATAKTSIDDIELLELLDRGNSCDVWLIRHKETKGTFALKRILRDSIQTESQAANVFAEKRHLIALDDVRGVVTLRDTFQDDEYLYFMLEYVNGGDLFVQLQHFGSFTEATTLHYTRQLVRIICEFHGRGYIHCDLKLKNIMVTAPEANVRIVDWAYSVVVVAPPRHQRARKRGTPHYMCPEVIDGGFETTAIDWWCLGVMVYWMLMGTPPFWHENPVELQRMIRCAQPQSLRPQCSKHCIDFVMRLLDKDTSTRLGDDTVAAHPWLLNSRSQPLQFNPNLGGADGDGVVVTKNNDDDDDPFAEF